MKFNPNDKSFEKSKFNVDNNANGEKWRGLVEHKDGHLYSIPSNGSKVVKINIASFDLTPVGDNLGNGDVNWLSCILGKVYGIPFYAPRVVRFDPSNNTSIIIGKKYVGQFKWCEGCVAADGKYLCCAI